MLGCTLEHRGFSCKQSATSALETCLFLELSLLLLHILSKKKKKTVPASERPDTADPMRLIWH